MFLKPQDFVFILFLLLLFVKRDARLFVLSGLAFFILSMPLFYKWIFFTAERFIIYGVIMVLIAIVLNLINIVHTK